MKDIMCRCAYPQEILFWSFWGAIYVPIFVRLQCLELPFIVYSILKQCWSVGYVSLLTLSFIGWTNKMLVIAWSEGIIISGDFFRYCLFYGLPLIVWTWFITHEFFNIKRKCPLNKFTKWTRNTVSNAHKMIPPLPHVLYGKVLVLLWETPKSFE